MGNSLLFVLGALAVCVLPVSHILAGEDTNPGTAKLYVYRYKQYVGSFLKPSIYCDDSALARVHNGTYLVVSVPAGKHTLKGEDAQTGIFLTAEPGKTYYVRVELVPGMLKGHGRLVSVPEDQGRFEVQQLKPIGSSKVRACE